MPCRQDLVSSSSPRFRNGTSEGCCFRARIRDCNIRVALCPVVRFRRVRGIAERARRRSSSVQRHIALSDQINPTEAQQVWHHNQDKTANRQARHSSPLEQHPFHPVVADEHHRRVERRRDGQSLLCALSRLEVLRPLQKRAELRVLLRRLDLLGKICERRMPKSALASQSVRTSCPCKATRATHPPT